MRVCAALICVFVAVLSVIATAEPTIDVYTDKSSYAPQEAIEVSLSAMNPGAVTYDVDVYVGLLTPDGDVFSLQAQGWASGIGPWMRQISLPAGFVFEQTPLWWFDLPSAMPPIDGPGQFHFAAALTHPGTFDWVCSASLAPFWCEAEPSTDMTMLSIPAGSFLMGSPSDEGPRDWDEGPQRTVNISAFEMSETEVTQKQWKDIMGWNDSEFRTDDRPVEKVTWFDCVSFCNELSEAVGYTQCYTIKNAGIDGNHITSADVGCDFDANGYRLPTEAEWEYACRAGTTTRFYTGDSDTGSDLDRAGWYYDNSDHWTHPVGEKEPNAWGLFDMHGNIWEWCWDWYSSGYYMMRPDPDSDPTGPVDGLCRVKRGGCWSCPGWWHCCSAARSSYEPSEWWSSRGFRVARSPN